MHADEHQRLQEKLVDFARGGANSDAFREMFENLRASTEATEDSLRKFSEKSSEDSPNPMAEHKIKRAKARKKKRKTGGRR